MNRPVFCRFHNLPELIHIYNETLDGEAKFLNFVLFAAIALRKLFEVILEIFLLILFLFKLIDSTSSKNYLSLYSLIC